jgi:UDP-N-acetylglucosamine diphosphorylase/glucosamine-1-phosphate N-acetyltransferase
MEGDLSTAQGGNLPVHAQRSVSAPGVIGDNPAMSNTRLIIWDDGGGDLGPLTDRRAAFELRTGAWTTRRRIESVLGLAASGLRVPPALEGVVREHEGEHGAEINSAKAGAADESVLLVSARWTAAADAQQVQALSPGQRLLQGDGQLVAAHLPGDQAQRLLGGGRPLPDWNAEAHVVRVTRRMLIDRPWHILDGLEQAMRVDLQATSAQARPAGAQVFGSHALVIAADAIVQPGTIFNLEAGPIVVETGATIGSGTVLEGPCFIGAHSVVQPLSLLRPHTAIGPHCKVAGEIAFSIFHAYSNKAHAGFLGHSLVGEWVNLGASTVASNLKNTYGPVRVCLRPASAAEDTGRMFQGPIFGDFVRTAIGTRIPTGSCLQTGTMLAQSALAPKSTHRFAFMTDQGERVHDLEKFLATARTMMGRRQLQLSAAHEARLRALYARAEER